MVKQVTSLTTGAVATLVTPGKDCHLISIQNIGSNQVNLSYDGGTAYTDLRTLKKGQDPTTGATGLGYVLPGGQALVITIDEGGPSFRLPIVGIMATGTTTLNITTDDAYST